MAASPVGGAGILEGAQEHSSQSGHDTMRAYRTSYSLLLLVITVYASIATEDVAHMGYFWFDNPSAGICFTSNLNWFPCDLWKIAQDVNDVHDLGLEQIQKKFVSETVNTRDKREVQHDGITSESWNGGSEGTSVSTEDIKSNHISKRKDPKKKILEEKFSPWGGKRNGASGDLDDYSIILNADDPLKGIYPWSVKRNPGFSSWGGKRNGNFYSWGGKRTTDEFPTWEDKQEAKDDDSPNKAINVRAAFHSWGGKRDNTQDFNKGIDISNWGSKRNQNLRGLENEMRSKRSFFYPGIFLHNMDVAHYMKRIPGRRINQFTPNFPRDVARTERRDNIEGGFFPWGG